MKEAYIVAAAVHVLSSGEKTYKVADMPVIKKADPSRLNNPSMRSVYIGIFQENTNDPISVMVKNCFEGAGYFINQMANAPFQNSNLPNIPTTGMNYQSGAREVYTQGNDIPEKYQKEIKNTFYVPLNTFKQGYGTQKKVDVTYFGRGSYSIKKGKYIGAGIIQNNKRVRPKINKENKVHGDRYQKPQTYPQYGLW